MYKTFSNLMFEFNKTIGDKVKYKKTKRKGEIVKFTEYLPYIRYFNNYFTCIVYLRKLLCVIFIELGKEKNAQGPKFSNEHQLLSSNLVFNEHAPPESKLQSNHTGK